MEKARTKVRTKAVEDKVSIVMVHFLSTTEFKIPSRTIVLQGWVSVCHVSCVPKSKHFELEG